MQDIDTCDFTLALDGLDAALKKQKLEFIPKHPKKLMGVKVNASAPFFEAVAVPLRHPIFDVGGSEFDRSFIGPISEVLECAMYKAWYPVSSTKSTLKTDNLYGPNGANEDDEDDQERSEAGVAYLNMSGDTREEHFGQIPALRSKNPASILVVSALENDLPVEAVIALCKIIEHFVPAAVRAGEATGSSRDTIYHRIMQAINRAHCAVRYVHDDLAAQPGEDGSKQMGLVTSFHAAFPDTLYA